MRRPSAAPTLSKWTEPARRLKRLHTLASLWLASATFMHSGVHSLGLRYALALPVASGLYLLLLAWVLSVLLGCGVDHWLPAAQSLPQALRMVHAGH